MEKVSYVRLPFRADKLIEKKEHPVCDIKLSISQNLFLILTTNLGESRFDDAFGNETWDWDFSLINNEAIWEEKVSRTVKQAILDYEKRLFDIEISIKITQEDLVDESRTRHRVKRKLEVNVKGKLEETRETYFYTQSLFLSPISYD